MAGSKSPLQFWLISVIELLFILPLTQQWEGVGVVSADLLGRTLDEDRQNCFDIVRSWSQGQLDELSGSALDRLKLQELLFFLHVPRTGGRSFHQCFLKHLFEADKRCKASYVKLRVEPGCRLVSTHDDYSIMEQLPHDVTSVVTFIRDPVDRLLSSYEFAIEVAARSLRKPKATTKASPRSVVANQFMSTLDIWPWKYLVPMMAQDLRARRDARLSDAKDSSPPLYEWDVTNGTVLTEVVDSYDTSSMTMPIQDYIRHPAVHELVHNGATFQVAGLTNTSYFENATAIRRCVINYPWMGRDVLKVAKKRLDRMLFVGLTDRQNDSALHFTKFVKDQISMEVFMKSILRNRFPAGRSKQWKIEHNFTSLAEFTQEEVIDEMVGAYTDCVNDLRRSQDHRRGLSLESLTGIVYSREKRKFIPASVIAEASGLNHLDTELHAHAQALFLQQQKSLQHTVLMEDPDKMSSEDSITDTGFWNASSAFSDAQKGFEGLWSLTIIWAVMVIILAIIGISVVTTRRLRRGVKET